ADAQGEVAALFGREFLGAVVFRALDVADVGAGLADQRDAHAGVLDGRLPGVVDLGALLVLDRRVVRIDIAVVERRTLDAGRAHEVVARREGPAVVEHNRVPAVGVADVDDDVGGLTVLVGDADVGRLRAAAALHVAHLDADVIVGAAGVVPGLGIHADRHVARVHVDQQAPGEAVDDDVAAIRVGLDAFLEVVLGRQLEVALPAGRDRHAEVDAIADRLKLAVVVVADVAGLDVRGPARLVDVIRLGLGGRGDVVGPELHALERGVGVGRI